jgi:PAS domain S-box-containing protein
LAQDAFHESEERFHTLAEAMPQIVWITRADGWNIYFNHQWMEYTGLTLEESYGHGWNKPFHPNDQKRAWDAWQNVVHNNGSYSLEFRLRRVDGAYRWWLVRGVPYFDESGAIDKWFGTCTDIHEIKQAEEKIRLSDIYNRSLIEASLDPLVTIGHDGKINDVNEATESVTGYSRDELIGTDFTNYFTEPEKAKEGYQEVFKEGVVFDYELEIRNKNGHTTPVLYNASIYKDEPGEVLGVFAAARNITERKRMEAELESIARLPQENPNPVIRLDQGRKISYSNPAAQILLTYWGCATSQEVPTAITELAIGALNDGIRREFEYNYTNKIYLLTFAPFSQADYVNVYFRDVTELKKTEETLRLKLEELSRSNEELEQFAYISSHDLQEPLRMITSYLQLLQRRYQGNLDDKADRYIHFAVDEASRMQNLIKDLLEYSRVTTKCREPEPTNCEFILNRVLSNLKLFIIKNKATVSHDSLPEVMVDSIQIMQIFQNLILNEMKFYNEKHPKFISLQRKKRVNGYFQCRTMELESIRNIQNESLKYLKD